MSRWRVAAMVLLVATLLGAAWQQTRIARANGLRADSLAASLDTTRMVSGSYLRRVLQLQLKADSLDKALKLKPKVVLRDTLRVDTLQVLVTAPVTGDTIREATFDVRQAPYTSRAHVALPAAPRPGTLQLTTTLDPIPLTVRLGCGPAVGGVRSAAAVVTGPTWASMQLGAVQADPEVCNPAAQFRGVRVSVPWWWLPVGVVGGFVVGRVVP